MTEETFELFAKDAVNDKVDGGVDSDQEIGKAVQAGIVDLHHLQDVGDESTNVADKKDQNHHHEHGGQANLLLLSTSHSRSFLARPLDLHVDHEIEHGHAGERDDVHDQQVEPGDVNVDVLLISS